MSMDDENRFDTIVLAIEHIHSTLRVHTELLRSIAEAAAAPPSDTLQRAMADVGRQLARGNEQLEKLVAVAHRAETYMDDHEDD